MKYLSLFILLIGFISIRADCPLGEVESDGKCFECGQIPLEPNVRIVGGIKAIPNSYPSQIYLEKRMVGTAKYKNNKGVWVTKKVDETQSCGGTLINKYTILTAAHCTEFITTINDKDIPVSLDKKKFPTAASALTVYLGAHDIGFTNDENIAKPSSVVVARVAKIIDHPSYNLMKNLEHDISLLILAKPIDFDDNILPACLPPRRSSFYPGTGLNAYIAGWGHRTENGNDGPNQLYNVKLRIYKPSECSKTSVESKKNWAQQICAGSVTSNRDTCQGDSGGGLYHDNEFGLSEKRFVVGVVSYGDGCGKKIPGIYTRVSYYLDWIKDNWKTE